MSTNSEDQQTSRDQWNKGISAPFPVPISVNLRQMGVLCVAYAAVACTAMGVHTASAQPEVIRCLPPEAPMTELPVDVLAEYRTEIAAEFEAYFSSVTEHIACLDEERARVLDEARAATEAYTRLINTIPVRKDFP